MIQKKAIEDAEKQKKETETQLKAEQEKKASQEKKKVEEDIKAKEKAEVEKKQKDELAKKKEADQKKQQQLKLVQDKKTADEKKQKEEKHTQQMEKLNQELDQFSVTLNKKHYDTALQIREDLKSGGEEPQMKVHTMDIYKKSFTFPQIAHNDYAVE